MKLPRILLALLCLFSGVSTGFAQDLPAVCYVYRIGEINVVLYYDAEHREPFDVHLEYPENFTDTLFCTTFDKQQARYEFKSKQTDSFATLPASSEKDPQQLELSLTIKGKTRKLMLDNFDNTLFVYVYDETKGDTNIRNAPKGTIAHKLDKDGSHMLNLGNNKDGWWRICGNFVASYGEVYEGELPIRQDGESWIHYSVVAVGTRNYGGQTLKLREQPSGQARAVYTFSKEITLRPLDKRGEWVKVQTLDKKHQGWIEEEWLCGNALTTCP